MDNVRRVYETTIQNISGFAGPVIDTVKRKVTAVAGAAQNNVPPVLAKKSYGVCTPIMSCGDKFIHFLMLGAPCHFEQFHCYR